MLLMVRQQALLFVVALQFLTRVPLPALRGYQPQWLAESARYFPLVGVLVGLVNVALWWLASRVLPNPVAIGLMLAGSLLLTGAFHEDGFADTCDGLGGRASKARALEIMKDSRIGAYGALGIVVMLGLKWTTLVALPRRDLPLLMVGAHCCSRWCATGLIWRLPYARLDDDAKAKPFAGSLTTTTWLASGAVALLAFVSVAALSEALRATLVDALLGATGAAVSIGVLAGVYLQGRLGGYTGDCLGAVQQLSELGFLLSGLAVLAGP